MSQSRSQQCARWDRGAEAGIRLAASRKDGYVTSGYHGRGSAMAKGQKKSNKEARKPKAEKTKTVAANPSTKEGVVRGLEHIKR